MSENQGSREGPPRGDAAGEGASAEAPSPPLAPVKPEDLDTQPFKLVKHAERASRQRRRSVQAELAVKRPKAKEFLLGLDRDSTLIGRDAGCDIVVVDDGVSRRHARIDKTHAGHFELVDLSSTNGTLVEGRAVSRMLLLDGDRFVVGDTRFTMLLQEQAEES